MQNMVFEFAFFEFFCIVSLFQFLVLHMCFKLFLVKIVFENVFSLEHNQVHLCAL